MLKMTEREFREKLLEKLVTRSPTDTTPTLAIEVVREAGLEFAPEPVELPDRLQVSTNGAYITSYDLDQPRPFLAIIENGATWDASFAEPRLIQTTMAEAVRRYNAYPGLRRKAQALVDSVRDNLAPPRQVYVEEETAALEHELAKGQK